MTYQTCVSSQHSVPSPDGALIATLRQTSLIINTYDGHVLRSITLSSEVVSKCRFVRWSRLQGGSNGASLAQENGEDKSHCSRILLADEENIRVFDIDEPNWSGRIDRAASNLGKVADVVFGHNADELLVVSDFGVKLTIWSLVTRRGVEIRDPKYLVQCYSFRVGTGHLAIITRPQAQDILMLLNPGDHSLVQSVELPTVDAQEISWSPDGRWLAIRDAASNGHKLLIYTADGHLFKTWTKEGENNQIGLGIKNLEWSPLHTTLAIGDFNDKVTLFSKNTFTPVAGLEHPTTIPANDLIVWQEQLDAAKIRSYTAAPLPASPPTSNSLNKSSPPAHGISVMAFNSDSSLLATKSDTTPTTVSIWSLHTGSAVAILIHHSPIRHISWHPTETDLLLLHCAIPEPAVHLWKSTWENPQIVNLPLQRASGRLEANWLLSRTASEYTLMLSSTHQYIICSLSSSGELIPTAPNLSEGDKPVSVGAEDMFDEGNSLDLSPIKIAHDETLEVHDAFGDPYDDSGSGFEMGNEMVEDTFHYRRHVKATT